MDNKAEKKLSGIRLDPETIKELKILAIRTDRSFNGIMKEAAEDILKKYAKKK